jgi:hypothetical protein
MFVITGITGNVRGEVARRLLAAHLPVRGMCPSGALVNVAHDPTWCNKLSKRHRGARSRPPPTNRTRKRIRRLSSCQRRAGTQTLCVR